MKVLLFFVIVLFFQVSIAQSPSLESGQVFSSSELSSKLQGDWYLSETEFVDGYGNDTDSSSFFSNKNENKKIVFKDDILKVFPDSTTRFYSGGARNYKFNLVYDSVYKANFLKVFTISKKNSKELESYEIIKCGYDELILKSYNYLNNALDEASFSIYYVYRRNEVDSILSNINGYWYHCSTDSKSIGLDSKDTSEITFTRIKNDSLCGEYDHRLELNFHRMHYNNQCYISSFTKYHGVAYIMNFMLDPGDNLLYFNSDKYIAYDILTLNRDELKISLNKEKTEFYKSNNTYINK